MNNIMNNLWIEKYRPVKIEDVIVDENTGIEINKIVKNKNMPNMILTGTPGVGKTTTLFCIARALYGKYFDDMVLELNASDERGIKLINSGELNYFCTQKFPYSEEDIRHKTGKKNNGSIKKYAPHRLIIFDEADNMTEKALPIISTLMDKFYMTTRFVFTCNTSSKIIESIQSRCKIIRYIRLSVDQISSRLEEISKLERIKYDINAIKEIAQLSNGDMRHAINLLQLVSDRFNNITLENIEILCETPPNKIISEILSNIKKDIKQTLVTLYELKESGYSVNDIFIGFLNYLKSPNTQSISEEYKMKVLIVVSEYLYNSSKYSDTDINLTCFAIDLSKV